MRTKAYAFFPPPPGALLVAGAQRCACGLGCSVFHFRPFDGSRLDLASPRRLLWLRYHHGGPRRESTATTGSPALLCRTGGCDTGNRPDPDPETTLLVDLKQRVYKNGILAAHRGREPPKGHGDDYPPGEVALSVGGRCLSGCIQREECPRDESSSPSLEAFPP